MVWNWGDRLHRLWNDFLFDCEYSDFKSGTENAKKWIDTKKIMTIFEKTGLYVSIFIIVVLLFLIVFSKHGILDYKMLKGKETTILGQIQTIDLTNQKLENEIKSLKTDMNYIKHVAKHEHDMAEEDELIFKDKSGTKRKTP